MPVVTDLAPDRHHRALADWQRRNFPELDVLLAGWSRHWRQEPFRLVAKMDDHGSARIDHGRFAGREPFRHARDMRGSAFWQAASIIRAQASTELGSIQQHRATLDRAPDEAAQMDVLRVMAEELRHGYQMVYLLAADDWRLGGADVAGETLDELLAMHTGTHVLDAFNIPFDSYLDNIVFAAVIDRVGKYQLQMQRSFSYAPMARSMGPMLSEEAFHLQAGMRPLKRIVTRAAKGDGDTPLDLVQRHLNKWVPRGLEMFGHEEGGATNVDLGFKDMANGPAQARYAAELEREVIRPLNREIVRAWVPDLPDPESDAMVDRIRAGARAPGKLTATDLFRLPDLRFLRRRGTHAFALVDAAGTELEDAAAVAARLEELLPRAYLQSDDHRAYIEALRAHCSGEAEPGAPGAGGPKNGGGW